MTLRIRTILIALFACLGVLMAAGTAASWWTLRGQSAAMEAMYRDQMLPLRDLRAVSDLYASLAGGTFRAFRDGRIGPDAALSRIEQGLAEAERRWQALRALPLAPGQRRVVEEATDQKRKVDEVLSRMLPLLRAEDRQGLGRILAGLYDPTLDPLLVQIGALTEPLVPAAEAGFAAARAREDRFLMVVAAMTLLGAVAAAVGLWLLISRVIRPLAGLTAATARLSQAEYGIAVPHADRRDEVGALARGLALLAANAARARDLEEEVRRRIASEAAERRAAARDIADRVERTIGAVAASLARSSTELRGTAEALTVAATSSGARAAQAAETAAQANAHVGAIAGDAEALAESIAEIARQVAEAERVARMAVQEAGATNTSVGALTEAAERIAPVVELIGAIAGQTNLLALNATIEAARAGEAGKGFAVVAGEVKALAAQTAKATGDIGTQITEMKAATEATVGAIRTIAGTIERMSGIADAIATAVEAQGATTRRIAASVAQAASGAAEVSTAVEQVSGEATRTIQALGTIRDAAGALEAEGAALRRGLGGVLEGLRAA